MIIIYFNYAINQSINQLLYTTPSQFRLHVLQGDIAGRRAKGTLAMSRVGGFVIYLFIWHGSVYFECTGTFNFFSCSPTTHVHPTVYNTSFPSKNGCVQGRTPVALTMKSQPYTAPLLSLTYTDQDSSVEHPHTMS